MNNQNENVVIIGASQGIGEALVKEYAKSGSNLVLLSRNEKAIEQLSCAIEQNANCFYRKCDVTVKDDVRYGIEFALEKLGSIDVLIINSGVGGPNWMDDFSADEFIKVTEVNTFGIAYALEYIIPLMKKQGYGTVAGVTTLADVRGYAGSSSYSASKAAASILLEAARVELKKDNIAVVTVRPGFVKTAMTDKNEFTMPFIMQPDKAARIIKKGIEKRKSIVQFPFPIVSVTRLVKFLPNWLFDWGMSKARSRE